MSSPRIRRSTSALALCSCLALSACGETDPAPPAIAAPAPVTTEAPATPASARPAPKRTMMTKPAMTTAAENLVTDPEFQSLWAPVDETGFGIYESYAYGAAAEVRFMAQSPAGIDVAHLTVKPSQSDAALTSMVVGGKGPLSASIWVSAAADEPPDIALASLLDNSMVSLTPDEGTRVTSSGVEFVAYRGEVTGDLFGALYLIASFTGKKPVVFAAPEVRASTLAKHLRRSASAPKAPTETVVRAARGFEAFRATHRTMSGPPRPIARATPRRSEDLLRKLAPW